MADELMRKGYKESLLRQTEPTNLSSLQAPGVAIEFDDIKYFVRELGRRKSKKQILKGITSYANPGELTAIMGPSGAGKTTLMNILAGYVSSNVTGQIKINGEQRNLDKFRHLRAYVMQVDHLIENLSVKETMDMAAAMKLPLLSAEARNGRVESILECFDMIGTKSTRAGSLSGGQRKRLSIALELLKVKPLYFLDEPTSGLDSSIAYKCVQLLKKLAIQEKNTIICTVHQPSARLLGMFHHLIVLSEGHCLYTGEVGNLVPFLNSCGLRCPQFHNPGDFIIELAAGEHGRKAWKKCLDSTQNSTKTCGPAAANENGHENFQDERWSKHEEDVWIPIEKADNFISAPFTPSPWSSSVKTSKMSFLLETKILTARAALTILRNHVLMHVRLFLHLSVALLMGLMYVGVGPNAELVLHNAGAMFFHIILLLFTAMMATILTFPEEMPILVKEQLNDWYSLKGYYIAKTIADFPFQIFFSFLYVLMIYFMTTQPLEFFRFALFLLMCCYVSIVAQTIGLVIGAVCPVQAAVFLGPSLTVPILLFAGFAQRISQMPEYLRWGPHISYVKYCFSGVLIALYGYDRPDLECELPYCHFKNPQKFLEFFDISGDEYLYNVGALTVITVLCRVSGYFVLKYRIKWLMR